MTQTRIDRYERAIEWLKSVRDGDVTIEGAPQVSEEIRSAASEFQMRSNPKRTNTF